MRHSALAAVLIIVAVFARTDASELAGLSPPTQRVRVLADTRVEEPPVFNGVSYASLPSPGQQVELQVFVPEAVGKLAYSYIVEFDDTADAFSANFEIVDAYTWVAVNILDASGRRQVTRRIDMPAPVGSRGPGRSILFISPPTVSTSGLIATLVLNATATPPASQPLKFSVSAAVYSTTPPTRLWHFNSDQSIFWR